MATYYWVNGNGTWNSSLTGNWSSQSGGSGGAGVPTTADDVIFDAASNGAGTGAFAVSISTGAACKNFTASGLDGTMTLSGSPGMTIAGSLSLPSSNFTMTYTGGMTFTSTGSETITTGGVTFTSSITINGVGGTFTLQDNWSTNSTRSLVLQNGTFDANNKNVTIGNFSLGSGTKTLILGSGTWTILGTNWNANTNVSNLTVNASTATITMTSASSKTFNGGAKTWPTLNQGGAGALTIAQSNTFANITDTVQPATITFTAGTTQTVNAFNASGTAGNQITLNSTSAGSLATLNGTGGIVNLRYVNIKDIRAQGYTEWNALVDQGAVDQGNNPGWNFITLGVKKILRRVFGRQIIRPVIEEIS